MALRARKLFRTCEKRATAAGSVLKVRNFSCGKEGYRVQFQETAIVGEVLALSSFSTASGMFHGKQRIRLMVLSEVP